MDSLSVDKKGARRKAKMANGVPVVGLAAAGALAAALLTLLRWTMCRFIAARRTTKKGKIEFATWREEPTNTTNAADPN